MNAEDEGPLRRTQSSRTVPSGSAARNKRQDEFEQIFELRHEELLEDFSCAYQSDKLLYHGRMYVSRNYVCFHSQIFKKTIKILEFKDIQDIQKKNTAIVFPNALEITAKNRKFLFSSFLYRDQAYKLVMDLLEESKRSRTFRSLAIKETRNRLESDESAREASFESQSSILDGSSSEEDEESDHESDHESDLSDSGAVEATPPFLPRSAPTPVSALAAASATDTITTLAPPDSGAKSASPPSGPPAPPSTAQLSSPPGGVGAGSGSISAAKLRNLSANISNNVNGWVNSVGWPSILRADDGAGDHVPEGAKKEYELKDFSSDGEARPEETDTLEDEAKRLVADDGSSQTEEQRQDGRDAEASSSNTNTTTTATTAAGTSPGRSVGGEDGRTATATVTTAATAATITTPSSADNSADGAAAKEQESGAAPASSRPGEKDASESSKTPAGRSGDSSGSRRKPRRKDDKATSDDGADNSSSKPAEAPIVEQTPVPVVEACAHVSGGPSTGQAMVNVLLPIAVEDVFYTFFDDKNPEVPGFWKELHEQSLGYSEVSMGTWAPQPENCCLRRAVGFRVPLKHPLGPKSTRVQQEQRIHYANKETLVMETSSVSLDVPYGDTFSTDTRWVLSAAVGANGKPHTRVTVNVNIKFTKSLWIKGVIQSNAVEGVSTYFPAWAEKAQKVLARKARAATAATASPLKRSSSRKATGSRSSKRPGEAAGGAGDTPTKRKTRRRALGEEGDGVSVATESALQDDYNTPKPDVGSGHGLMSQAGDQEQEADSVVAALVHMVFPNLPIPRISTRFLVGLVALLVLAYFLLPSLWALPSLSGRVASLEGEVHALRQANTRLRDRLLFMQLTLSALTPDPSTLAPGEAVGGGGGTPPDTLPELWRYWKLHRGLRERVEGLVRRLRDLQALVGHLNDDMASVLPPGSAPSSATAPGAEGDLLPPDYMSAEFLNRLACALDGDEDDELAFLDTLDSDAEANSKKAGWLWTLFVLVFVWIPVLTLVAALAANSVGLLPPVLPFALPLTNVLRPYVSLLVPLPPSFVPDDDPPLPPATASSSST